MSDKLRPFSLEQALAGKAVYTRNGIPVTQLHNFDAPKNDDNQTLYGVLNNRTESWSISGRYYDDRTECISDLFMGPEKHERWVNIHRFNLAAPSTAIGISIYTSKEEALKSAASGSTIVATIPINWEE